MRKNQSSLTTAGIAIARAVESEKPVDERICYDPYARQFVPAWMLHLMGIFIKSVYAQLRGPGVNGFLMAREHYIDEVLQQFLVEGLQQLVIVGAGYDSRGYRLDLAGRVKVFEMDHPVTQAEKVKRARRIFDKPPEHIRYVPVDFNTQAFSECLVTSCYDPHLFSLFIWQGVTVYLPLAGVDATLDFIVKNPTPGSAVVFDYLYQAVLEATQRQNEIRNMRRYRFMTGEDLSFGITQGKTDAFLRARGFRQVKDVTTEELRKDYFTGKNANRKMVGGYGIVVGRV